LNAEKLITKDVDIRTSGDVAVAANGALYSKKITGIMPELVKTIYDERVQYKRNMLSCKQQYEDNPTEDLAKQISKWSNFQMARKIQLNSLYGALGNQYFRHYKLENAEAITLTGQVTIRWIERKLNEYINTTLSTTDVDYVIASDTDSIYLNLGPLVSLVFGDNTDDRERIVTILNQFSEDKIVPFIDESYKELSDYLQCYEETLVMKRECIAEKGIWTAKKRYILNVWDNEGVRYKEPKLKMMGIEAVRSSTPAPCRKYIKDTLKIIMEGTEDDLINYIERSRTEFEQLGPEKVAFPRTANNIYKFMDSTTMFKKGTPMHIRAAIMFNHYIHERNLNKKYNSIMTGEKIKYIHLKTPNPTGQNVIGMISEFPKEFELTNYIDYDTMFDKSFIEPLKVILDIIGWKTEQTSTLDSFFV
jgi:DNA polymerase elongation subunit (family B)